MTATGDGHDTRPEDRPPFDGEEVAPHDAEEELDRYGRRSSGTTKTCAAPSSTRGGASGTSRLR